MRRPPMHTACGRWRSGCHPLRRIMKDDADGMATAGSNTAHPVAENDAIRAAAPLYRSVVYRKYDRVPLVKRHYLSARLHPRSLLR